MKDKISAWIVFILLAGFPQVSANLRCQQVSCARQIHLQKEQQACNLTRTWKARRFQTSHDCPGGQKEEKKICILATRIFPCCPWERLTERQLWRRRPALTVVMPLWFWVSVVGRRVKRAPSWDAGQIGSRPPEGWGVGLCVCVWGWGGAEHWRSERCESVEGNRQHTCTVLDVHRRTDSMSAGGCS